MTTGLRKPLLSALLLFALLAAPLADAAIPGHYPSTDPPQPEMYVATLSEMLTGIRQQQRCFARAAYFRAAYRQAAERGEYRLALACTDSLLRSGKHCRRLGTPCVNDYKLRALALKALHRTPEACRAYALAIEVQDSLMRITQKEAVRSMLASYEQGRQTLDQALIRARNHRRALIAIVLLVLTTAGVVSIIYAGNRHTEQLQRELLQKIAQVQESEQKKVAFINSMCHEVRTPLNSIAGFSEQLCNGDPSPEAQAQYREIIRQSRRQLRYLFDDMLEVARLENHNEPLPLAYTDLCTLCHMQIRIMKARHFKPGVVYEESIPTTEIGMLSNEKYITLLLAALLDNARKFTDRGFVRLECDREGDSRVKVVVTDSGCGIPTQHYGYVFERFTKLDTFSQGNGLGLYLCRLIVRHLGGEIHIDPTYTGGTRMVVSLPRRSRASQ